MEKPPVNPVNKVELPKTEQSFEHFSLSEQEKNIQEIFKINPELKTIASDSLGIEDNKDIVIELGRNKENDLGKVQNINVYYKGEKIVDSDGQDSSKLYLVTKEDGTSYVGDIFIPTELQGQGLGKKILQKVADTLDTKITPTYLSTGGFTSENAKKMWEKIGNEILPNHEAEGLYAEYLKTVFPKTKVEQIVWHGSNYKFDEFSKIELGKTTSSDSSVEGFFFADNIEAAKFYANKERVLTAYDKIKLLHGNENFKLKKLEKELNKLKDKYSETDKNKPTFSLKDKLRDSINKILSGQSNIEKEIQSINDQKNKLKSEIEKLELDVSVLKTNRDDLREKLNIAKKIHNDLGVSESVLEETEAHYVHNVDKYKQAYEEINNLFTIPEYGKYVYPILLNIQKPEFHNDKGTSKSFFFGDTIRQDKEKGADSTIIKNTLDPMPLDLYVVFDPSQIHMIGSEKDQEKFRKFCKKEKIKKDSKYEPLKYVLEIADVENAKQLVDKLSEFETKAGFEKVFDKLKSTEILEKIKVKFTSQNGDSLARYSQARNTLEIDSTYSNMAEIGDFYVSVLHELFHHVFRGADISSGLNSIYGITNIKNTIEKLPVHNKYRNLYSLVLHNISESEKKNYYGLKSVDEFISEAYSNPAFQNFLKSVEFKNKKSVSSKAVDLLLSVVTLNNRISANQISEKDAFSAFQKIDLESLNLLEDFEKNMKNYSQE
jgi:predicted GNAT family acetyltransferase